MDFLDQTKLRFLVTKVENFYSIEQRKNTDLGDAVEVLKQYLND